MNVSFPYQFDNRGRTRAATDEQHIKNLIEQVLFTAPGERVMRPTFGSGIRELVFSPGNDSLAMAVQSTVNAALQQYLGERIVINGVNANYEEGVLRVEVQYTVIQNQDVRTVLFNQTL